MAIYEFLCNCDKEIFLEIEIPLEEYESEFPCPLDECECAGKICRTFRTPPYVQKIFSQQQFLDVMSKRSLDHSLRTKSESMERIKSGEAFNQGSVFSQKYQDRLAAKRGMKKRNATTVIE